MWNRLGHPSTSADVAGSVAQETEKIIQFNVSSSVDGKFQFKRRKGCQYRAPRSCGTFLDDAMHSIRTEVTSQKPPFADTGQSEATPSPSTVWDPTTFLRTSVPRWAVGNGRGGADEDADEAVALVQKRIGRCGRVLLDLDFDLPDFLLR